VELGKYTAKNAVKLACERVGLNPDRLLLKDQQALCDALRPMLRTLMGRAKTELVLARVVRPDSGAE